MKAISLHQPWASLVMQGVKRLETRSWAPPASLVGERVLVHAAKRLDRCVLERPFSEVIRDPGRDAPIGVLLGSVLIEGAWEIEREADVGLIVREYHRRHDGLGGHFEEAIARELAFGDFELGRWAWGLGAPRRLNVPIPWGGRQRFFEVGQLTALLGPEHRR